MLLQHLDLVLATLFFFDFGLIFLEAGFKLQLYDLSREGFMLL